MISIPSQEPRPPGKVRRRSASTPQPKAWGWPRHRHCPQPRLAIATMSLRDKAPWQGRYSHPQDLAFVRERCGEQRGGGSFRTGRLPARKPGSAARH
jgi:hypothetical protein